MQHLYSVTFTTKKGLKITYLYHHGIEDVSKCEILYVRMHAYTIFVSQVTYIAKFMHTVHKDMHQ